MNRTYRVKRWKGTFTGAAIAVLACAGGASAQVVDNKVPLNYNYHGMVHPTEWGTETASPWNNADASANLYRAIADRGLYFNTADVHAFGSYPLVGSTGIVYELFNLRGYGNTTAAGAGANELDIVHLGARGVYHFPFEIASRVTTAAAMAPAWCPNLNITGLSGDGSAVTATTDAPHGLVVGDVVNIIGASVLGYNGRQTVATVPNTTQFTFASTQTGATTGSIFCNNTRLFITALSGNGTTVTGTTNVTHGMTNAAGTVVVIQGSSIPEYNGTWPIVTASGSTFTFSGVQTGSPTGTAIIAGTCDNTTDQVTVLSSPVTVDANTEIGVLYMVSNGGAQSQFDCVLTFNNGATDTNVTVRLSANDWFGNAADPAIITPPFVVSQKKITHTDAATTFPTFRAAQNEDNATLQAFSASNAGPNLNVVEAVISVPAIIAAGQNVAGQQLTKVAFRNAGWPFETVTAAASDGTTVTVTITGTNSNQSYAVGQPIEIRGMNVAALNGTYQVSALVGTTQIQYKNSLVGATASTSNQAYVQTPAGLITTPTAGTSTGGITTITTAVPHLMAVGDYVKLSGYSTAGLNGYFRVLTVSGSQFTIANTGTGTTGQRQISRIGCNRGYSVYAVSARTGSPVNATCAGALGISAGTTVGSNPHTLNASPATTCGGGNDTTSVWYAYSSPTGGMVEVRTCDTVATFDTTLAVYSNCSGTQVAGACNDNICGTGSRVRWTAAAGVPYYIRLAGVNNAIGTFTLTLADPAPVDITMPIQFNWNGICHGATEQTIPDATGATHENRSDLNGFRAIADRGLLCDGSPGSLNAGGNSTIGTQGIEYTIYGTTLQADMVHLGNRNVVANGARTFSPPGTIWPTSTSNNGLSPLWLNNVDQTTPQTSSMSGLNAVMGPKTRIGLLYHASDVTVGNFAKFDVKLDFSDSTSIVVTVLATDWFWNNAGVLPAPTPASGLEVQRVLGIYRATQNTDKGTDTGAVQSGGWLKVDEAVISRDSLVNSGFPDISGKTLTAITFQNPIAGSGTAGQVTTNSAFAIYSATLRDPASFNLNFGPAAIGTVTPNNLIAGGSGKMTVTVSRGSGAPNNITSVIVNAAAIGLSGTLALNDSGTGGDMSPNDNIWSTNVAFPVNATPQAYSLPYTVTDAQARTAMGNIIFSVVPPNGQATPSPAIAGSAPVLTVTMSNNGTPSPGISSITVEASALGLGTITLLDNGLAANGDATANNGVYSAKLPVPVTAAATSYLLPFTVTDTSLNTYMGSITLAVTTPTAAVAPTSVVPGATAKLTVTTTPPTTTTSLVTTVVSDLSSITLSNSVVLNDSGTNGDVTASDGIYSVDFTVPMAAPTGQTTLGWAVNDSTPAQLTGSLNFTVIGPPANTPIGAISGCGTTVSGPHSGNQVTWYTFTLASDVSDASGSFLDIDTSGSTLDSTTLINDTYIAIYRDTGAFVALDDDDGPEGTSALSFGLVAPSRGAVGNGVAYNGRDGTLTAGTYYLGVTAWTATASTTVPWGLSSTSTNSGTIVVNARLGSTAGPGTPPAVFNNMGSVAAVPATSQNSTQALSAGGVAWFKVNVGTTIDGSAATRHYLDIDTEGSAIADTGIVIFRADGTLVATDDNSGSGTYSMLSFGRGTRAQVGDGLAYAGQSGVTLAAGDYYIGVTHLAASWGGNFSVFCNSGTQSGNVTVNLRTGVQSRVLAGPLVHPINNHRYYLLESGFSWTNNEAYAVASLRGHLATINDADENEWVRVNVLRWPDGLTDRRGFIGYYDPTLTNDPLNTAGLFVWVSGQTPVFTAWSGGEPNNGLGGTEHYAEMLGSNGLWNDVVDAGITAGDFAVVEAPCPGDFNLDNSVTIDDLFLYINAYFLGLPSADMNNSNGSVTIDDLFLYINFYFTC